MGHILSKVFKLQMNESKVSTVTKMEAQTQTTDIQDFQSSSNNLLKTPVFVKEKNSAKEYDLEFLKSQMLKNLNLDPRSPTVGIYRTPIVVQDLSSSDYTPIKCDSPVSVYSSNCTFLNTQEVMTPLEPSVNVSGFEKTKESEDEFPSSYIEEHEIIKEKEPLKISDEPNTSDALKLLKEIQLAEEENFIKRVQLSAKKNRKRSSKIFDKKVTNEFKLCQTKTRTPLSNITSATNSPSNQPNSNIKLSARKILPETGTENSFSPKPQHLVQWDKNNTVII